MINIEIKILNHIKDSEHKLHAEINDGFLCSTLNITYEEMIKALENLVQQGILNKKKFGYIGSLTKEDVAVYTLV